MATGLLALAACGSDSGAATSSAAPSATASASPDSAPVTADTAGTATPSSDAARTLTSPAPEVTSAPSGGGDGDGGGGATAFIDYSLPTDFLDIDQLSSVLGSTYHFEGDQTADSCSPTYCDIVSDDPDHVPVARLRLRCGQVDGTEADWRSRNDVRDGFTVTALDGIAPDARLIEDADFGFGLNLRYDRTQCGISMEYEFGRDEHDVDPTVDAANRAELLSIATTLGARLDELGIA
ncbi:MAG: hypothetical protein JWN99_3444 [Ilumatobacteraceae bacterium]|nr:hypothetical protein [Ilumatobacteraceae bacterium]